MRARWHLIAAALLLPTLAGGVVVAVAHLPMGADTVRFLTYLPWLALGLAVILALLFGRYGVILFVGLLLVLYLLAGLAVTAEEAAATRELIAASLGAILLALAFRPEPWSPALVGLLLALIGGAGAWLLSGGDWPALGAARLRPLIPAALPLPTSLPTVAILLAGLAAGLVRALLRPAATGVGILAGAAAITAALYHATAPLTAEVAWTIAGLAVALALILEGHRMAYRDELTGLPGRRALMERLARPGRRYTVAMLDIDHFKSFNDTYGHEAGDQVLRYVATRLARGARGVRVFRYGGEEFTLLFPGADIEAARSRAEALRAAIADTPFMLRGPGRDPGRRGRGGGQPVGVTVSLGLAQRRRGERPAAVLERADTALYRAKEKGRNRVVGDAGGG
ncbi:MAG: diguanylate cyclase [Thiohalospira sp.]